MMPLNKTCFISVCLFTSMSFPAIAIENITTVCSLENDLRLIEVVYTGENNVPCKVEYTKEEGTQKLWGAESSAGYCESKANDFIQKQKSWGWTCETAFAVKKEVQ